MAETPSETFTLENTFLEHPDIVSVEDMLKMLDIGRNTAYKLLGNGSIKSIKVGKTHKIPKKCIIAYMNSCVK